MASKPEDGGGGNAPQGVNPATDAQHIASPDFDGEKVVVVQPPQTDDNAQNLPQPTATLVNTDPRSLPQVVGIEDDGNSPPQTWAVDADPKSFPQAVGTKHDGDNDKGMTVAGAPATEPAVTAGTARTMAINGEDGDEESGSRDSKRQLKRKRMLFIIAGVVFLVTALAVGLGVGLTSRKSSSHGGGHHHGNGEDGDDGEWEDDENTRRGISSSVLPKVLTMAEVRQPAGDMTLEYLLSDS